MTRDLLARLIMLAGLAQLGVLIASAQVPMRLQWRNALDSLPRLHRQMYWVYGGYVVLSIVAFAVISLTNASAMANGTRLSRSLCAYIAVFWGIRVALQGVFDASEYLTTPLLKAGYHTLTAAFALLTLIYAWAALA